MYTNNALTQGYIDACKHQGLSGKQTQLLSIKTASLIKKGGEWSNFMKYLNSKEGESLKYSLVGGVLGMGAGGVAGYYGMGQTGQGAVLGGIAGALGGAGLGGMYGPKWFGSDVKKPEENPADLGGGTFSGKSKEEQIVAPENTSPKTVDTQSSATSKEPSGAQIVNQPSTQPPTNNYRRPEDIKKDIDTSRGIMDTWISYKTPGKQSMGKYNDGIKRYNHELEVSKAYYKGLAQKQTPAVQQSQTLAQKEWNHKIKWVQEQVQEQERRKQKQLKALEEQRRKKIETPLSTEFNLPYYAKHLQELRDKYHSVSPNDYKYKGNFKEKKRRRKLTFLSFRSQWNKAVKKRLNILHPQLGENSKRDLSVKLDLAAKGPHVNIGGVAGAIGQKAYYDYLRRPLK